MAIKADDNRVAALVWDRAPRTGPPRLTEAQRKALWWRAHVATVRLLLAASSGRPACRYPTSTTALRPGAATMIQATRPAGRRGPTVISNEGCHLPVLRGPVRCQPPYHRNAPGGGRHLGVPFRIIDEHTDRLLAANRLRRVLPGVFEPIERMENRAVSHDDPGRRREARIGDQIIDILNMREGSMILGLIDGWLRPRVPYRGTKTAPARAVMLPASVFPARWCSPTVVSTCCTPAVDNLTRARGAIYLVVLSTATTQCALKGPSRPIMPQGHRVGYVERCLASTWCWCSTTHPDRC